MTLQKESDPPEDENRPATASGAVGEVPIRRGTLPPPEWSAPRSVSGLALEWLTRHAPISRRKGSRAELASLRAKLQRATAAGDQDGQRSAATALARALAARGSELDAATKLARRALVLGEDPALREELSSWFSALGEPGLAAATLRPLVETETGERLARLLTRIAVFLGRHGDASGAAEALANASSANPADPVADELRGAIGAWAPDAVPPFVAAEAYLEAARRRERADRAAAFEDLLRAFEIAPAHSGAAEALALSLSARGRQGAADEVLREHARAAGDRGAMAHRARLRDAVVDGDSVRALAAAFDAGLDRNFDPHAIVQSADSDQSGSDLVTFDRLVTDVRLTEIAAARLELAAESLKGAERAKGRVAAGRIAASALGNAERAVDAWIDALTSDPGNETAKALLRQHAVSFGDHGALVEALVRIGLQPEGDDTGARAECLRELVVLADQRLADPSLALWAVRRLLAENERDEEFRAIASRLAQRARLQDEELAATRVVLNEAKGPVRLEQLRVAAVALRGRPDDAEEYRIVLAELSELVPEERAWRYVFERLLVRLGRLSDLEALFSLDLERKLPKAQHERARLALSALARARGDRDRALELLIPLLSDGAVHRAAWAMIFVLATTTGRVGPRAEALCRIASVLEPGLGALLASIASDLLLADEDRAGARRAAEQACHADSSSPRSIASLARATIGLRDRVAAVALERTAGVVLPRAPLCRALADTFDALGEPENALAWVQRWLALRPGDRAAASAFVSRVTNASDPARIADAFGWLLAQPEPLVEHVPLLREAIKKLSEIDPARAAALARRALDVFGPRLPELSEAILAVADSIGERGLAIAVVERKLASGAPGGDRATMLLDLARRRRQAGDADGAPRSLVRALSEGADPSLVSGELDVALPPRGSDGEIALLEARAETLSAHSSAELEGTARAWRDYGAALWDLADDRDGAVAAWERAAALDGDSGVERFARDLVTFGGHAEATKRLEDLATRRRNRPDVAKALAAAAAVALEGGLEKEALALAIRALEADSTRTDVLGIAERASTGQDIADLERAYEVVGRASLGIYGERATHYRAARKLEQKGHREAALRHAVLAFEAVPAEGVSFVLMMRLAERTGESTDVIAAIERVAGRSASAAERAVWLRRAALVAGSGDEGKRQRVDVLLRALEANPHGETLRSLGAAMADLVRAVPDERDIAELRFDRALKAMLPRLDGPDGARTAVFAATTALGAFDSAELALGALFRAVDADASLDEFETLVASAPALAKARDRAAEFVAHVAELVASPYANVETPLIDLGEAVALAVGDRAAGARLLVTAALRNPDDKDRLRRAEEAAKLANDQALLDAVIQAVPVEDRVARLFESARACVSRGEKDKAIEPLTEIRALERVPEASRREATLLLRGIYKDLDRTFALEALLVNDAEAARGTNVEVALLRELATFLGDQERFEEALAATQRALAITPKNKDLLTDLWNHARQAESGRAQIEALAGLIDVEAEPAKRLAHLRRLAPLLAGEGDEAGALVRYKEILSIDERDLAALGALERDAEQRSDWEALAELLVRRASFAHSLDEARQVRLHRVEILESRLGRPEDARAELESLLAGTGDNLVVLRRLADLNERLGAKLRAAPLWLRVSAIPKDRAEAGEFARRACQAYLDGGDVESARRVFAEMSEYPRTAALVALRVDIERRGENPRALSEALEEMALSSMDPPQQRATLLVEAARAALSAGQAQMALGQAQRAARIAREMPAPQLLARFLEYRQRGVGSREEAMTTVTELRSIRDALTPPDWELRAFLLAEALDVVSGEGEGMRELSRVHAEIGPLPLVALGIAERLARGAEPERALSLFDAALDGDLRELRRRGEVALAAAAAAQRLNQLERALDYLDVAAAMPDTRARALGIQTELRGALGRLSDAPPLPDAPLTRGGTERPAGVVAEGGTQPLYALSDPHAVSNLPGAHRDDPIPLSRRATPEPVLELTRPSAEPIELTRQSQQPIELRRPSGMTPAAPEARSETPPPGSLRASAPPKPSSRGPATTARGIGGETPPVSPPPAVSMSSTVVVSDGERERRKSSDQFQAVLTRSPLITTENANEEALVQALNHGSIEAGRELMRLIEQRPERTQDLVNVCRRLAHYLPGDRWVLESLYEATLADRNIVYARAVEHVLRAFDPKATALEAPALSEQIEQPDRVHALLFRDTASHATEALGLVWTGAQHMFRRDPASYGVTGLERIAPNAPTPLGRVFGGSARLLGMTRTPLFQRRSGESVTINVALLSPPALLLTGEVKNETPALAYHMGAMLAATLPEHVLIYGAPELQVKNVLRALLAAFGPPQVGRGNLASIATLAEMLWESIPPRSQRRLRELCDDFGNIDYDFAVGAARQAVRRAGLFVSGDLTVAVRETCADLGVSTWNLDSPGGLAALCSSSPAVADLVRLATSPEYANARWQQIRGGAGRPPSGTWATV
jgi:cellulose synthase operon protein C